jgi:hypothetical protein
MKAKVARKAVRHPKPMRKVTRGKKHAHAAAIPEKKEAVQNVVPEAEMMVETFEAPVEFFEVELQPVVDTIEVFEYSMPGDVDEG